MTKKLAVVISQTRGSPSSRQKLPRDLGAALEDWPSLDVVTLPHLYDLAPDGPGMRHLQGLSGDMIVLSWLYPRAAFWVLDANGVKGRMGRTPFFPEEELETSPEDPAQPAGESSDRSIWCLDLREHDQLEPMLEEIDRIAAESAGEPVVALAGAQAKATGGATRLEESTQFRWYPVVDYGRCGNCLECLNFCLFGVFGLDESGQLLVEQPDACRDGCPACSRVCPSHAIMFPQHNNPVIAGDPEASTDGFNLNLVQLLGSASAAELAAAERDRALAEKTKADKSGPKNAAEKDDLDQLVDELDGMDL
ncbi:MAG: ATP-binding protein [Planctomycetota bacterium]|jgi:NAD-dependent dihydropyrimidine dehydrogenase PreA subunit